MVGDGGVDDLKAGTSMQEHQHITYTLE
jgi:hypothetical protein